MTKQKKFILSESEIPTQWYNILADMPIKTGTGHGAPLDRYPRGGAGEV